MRKLLFSTALAALGAVVLVPQAQAVPSFTRQTGMTCNQCHVLYGAPVPNFTFTGKKFRMNGYRMPFVTEKIEAGEEGAIGGNRLALNMIPYLSFRYQSVFAQQAKAPGATDWGTVSSNPTSRLAIFPAGAFGDYFGMWVELYLTPDGSTTGQWTQGVFSFDEFDLRAAKITDNATLGFAFNNQSIKEVSGFGPWPVGLTSTLTRGGFAGWSHPNRGNMYLYGFFNDQLLAVVGASPGEDNLDWNRRNYQAQVAFWPLHSDANELSVTSMVEFGDDGLPLTTRVSPSRDGTLSWRYSDAVSGISATRTGTNAGQVYQSADLGDLFRIMNQVRYGFVDHGPSSMEAALNLTFNKETYSDNAEIKENALGGAIRYQYMRTWGLDVAVNKHLTWEFTDMNGTVHDIGDKVSYRTYLSFRPTMNTILALSYGNSQRNSLDVASSAVPTGQSWTLNADILF